MTASAELRIPGGPNVGRKRRPSCIWAMGACEREFHVSDPVAPSSVKICTADDPAETGLLIVSLLREACMYPTARGFNA